MRIFVIGLPGSGKTTLGRQLAHALQLPFFDLDQGIEAEQKMPVREIFRTKGEVYFRKTEAGMLRKITQGHAAFVLATGGGTPCFFDNMNFMNEAGITIFLNLPVEEIAQRMSDEEKEKRPVFKNQPVQQILEELLAERLSFYKRARYTVTHADLPALVRLLTVLRK